MMDVLLVSAVNGVHKDDTYELLVKAIGAYNQGKSVFEAGDAWLDFITNEKTPSSAQKTAMEYGMSILHDSSKGIGLGYRNYVWEGGTYPPIIFKENGELDLDVNGVPKPHPEAGKLWCFEYGELDWKNNKIFETIKIQSNRHATGYPKTGDVDNRIGCS